jgi:hypothetical protein
MGYGGLSVYDNEPTVDTVLIFWLTALNNMKPTMNERVSFFRVWHSLKKIMLVLCIVCCASSCALFRSSAAQGTDTGYRSSASVQRAISEAKSYMVSKGLHRKYYINSAVAYDKGSYWNVCFKPRSGFFRKCVEIQK